MITTYPRSVQVEISGDLKELFDKFPILGDGFMIQSCIGIPKIIIICGQMLQPWGQIMLTNHYKSPPIAQPGVGGD